MGRLLSLNVGLPKDVTWNGKTVRTAIWKSPVEERRMVRKLNVDEPMQAQRFTGQQDIARIVKETISALNIGDDRSGKQRDDIVRALTESKGRVGGVDGAAARMGINRTTLLSRMRKFGIDSSRYV